MSANSPANVGGSVQGSTVLKIATLGILFLHFSLLLASLPNYRASVDSAYHVSLARQYGKFGVYFWDRVHYAPAHRPNLQGPAIHFMIGMLGNLLGGRGDDYVMANAILGLLCWLVTQATVVFFARRFGGDLAGLLAASVASGVANESGSLGMNMPGIWMYVATAWAIHFFIERKLVLAIVFTVLACYAHLGGFVTAPMGIVAAVLCRWRSASFSRAVFDLAIVGTAVCVFTAPYWIHVLQSLPWYVGVKGETAWWIDPLAVIFWICGLSVALRHPHHNVFLISWAASPLVWIVQDPCRFILLSAVTGTVMGGVAFASWINRLKWPRARLLAMVFLPYQATIFPLGIPAIAGEIFWLVKPFPVMMDWAEMRSDAEVIRSSGLEDGIVQGYTSYVVSALSVWSDIQAEKGHLIEVQPPVDPANEMGIGEKTYVLAIPPTDECLVDWESRGWLRNYGGGQWSTVLRFEDRPTVEEALQSRNATWARDADWIANHSEHNGMGDIIKLGLDAKELPRRRAVRGECRKRVTRMQIGLMLYAYSVESHDPGPARRLRDDCRALGWLAAVVGDEMALDYRTSAAHMQLQRDMKKLSEAVVDHTNPDAVLQELLDHFLMTARGSLTQVKSQP